MTDKTNPRSCRSLIIYKARASTVSYYPPTPPPPPPPPPQAKKATASEEQKQKRASNHTLSAGFQTTIIGPVTTGEKHAAAPPPPQCSSAKLQASIYNMGKEGTTSPKPQLQSQKNLKKGQNKPRSATSQLNTKCMWGQIDDNRQIKSNLHENAKHNSKHSSLPRLPI